MRDGYYTHIDRRAINRDMEHGTRSPVISISHGADDPNPAKAIRVRLPEGAEIVYSPHEALVPSGARLVIVSDARPEVLE